MSTSAQPLRNLKNIAFCWLDKTILRRIREQIEERGSASAVYLALTAIASDKQTEEFQTTHKRLSELSGFSVRTVRDRLHDLERIKAVEIHTPALKTASTFRLLASGNGCRSSGNDVENPLPIVRQPLPPVEEIGEEGTELQKMAATIADRSANGFGDEESGRRGQPGICLAKTEADRLEEFCFKVLGKDCMATFGATWRQRAKSEPQKLRRVLEDLKADQREGKHVRNPGAIADIRWKEFK